jgi:hypothetical protein
MLERALLGLLLTGALVAGSSWWSYRHGKEVATARAAAQRKADEDAAERQRETQRVVALAASAEYERRRRDRDARRPQTLATVEKSLGGPISCPPGQLGDLWIPGDALAGLRDAAVGAAQAAGSAASEPRR